MKLTQKEIELTLSQFFAALEGSDMNRYANACDRKKAMDKLLADQAADSWQIAARSSGFWAWVKGKVYPQVRTGFAGLPAIDITAGFINPNSVQARLAKQCDWLGEEAIEALKRNEQADVNLTKAIENYDRYMHRQRE